MHLDRLGRLSLLGGPFSSQVRLLKELKAALGTDSVELPSMHKELLQAQLPPIDGIQSELLRTQRESESPT